MYVLALQKEIFIKTLFTICQELSTGSLKDLFLIQQSQDWKVFAVDKCPGIVSANASKFQPWNYTSRRLRIESVRSKRDGNIFIHTDDGHLSSLFQGYLCWSFTWERSLHTREIENGWSRVIRNPCTSAGSTRAHSMFVHSSLGWQTRIWLLHIKLQIPSEAFFSPHVAMQSNHKCMNVCCSQQRG